MPSEIATFSDNIEIIKKSDDGHIQTLSNGKTLPSGIRLVINKENSKTALMLRVGGLGDIVILTPIAKALHNKGYQVDFFCGSPTGKVSELIEGLPYIHQVKSIDRINGIDCIEVEDKHFVSIEIFKPNYDEVFDYRNSIEENRPAQFLNKDEGWRHTINSNYANWVDLSLAWSNIDPTTIPDSDKLPEISGITTSEEYTKWLNTYLPDGVDRDYNIIGIQLQASSLLRSWYRAKDLPEIIHKKYPNDIVIIFTGAEWTMISKNGTRKIELPENLNPLKCSAHLIFSMDAFISADSGMSHIAEAVYTPCITIYTTVPAWTRDKYYKFAYPLQASCVCSPCFTLEALCPLQKKAVEESLSDREKDIFKAGTTGISIFEVAKKYETVPMAIEQEFASINQKIQALSAHMPACVASITPDMILEKLEQVLNV
jgi:ADP-heptose:LPS heptosyltransferase